MCDSFTKISRISIISAALCSNFLCAICKADYHVSDGNLVREYLFGTVIKKQDVNPIRLVDTGDKKYIYLVQHGPMSPALSIYAGNNEESISTIIAVVNQPSSIAETKIKLNPTQSGLELGRQEARFIPNSFPDGDWPFQTTAIQLLVLATKDPAILDSELNAKFYNLKTLVESGYTKRDLFLRKTQDTDLVYDIVAIDEYAKNTSLENFVVGRLELTKWDGFQHATIRFTQFGKGPRRYPIPGSQEFEDRWTITMPQRVHHGTEWKSDLSPFGKAETFVTDERHSGTTSDGFLFYILPAGSPVPFSDTKLIKNLIRRSDGIAPTNSNTAIKWSIILLIFFSALAIVMKRKKQNEKQHEKTQPVR